MREGAEGKTKESDREESSCCSMVVWTIGRLLDGGRGGARHLRGLDAATFTNGQVQLKERWG